jgi:phage gpG-like protein
MKIELAVRGFRGMEAVVQEVPRVTRRKQRDLLGIAAIQLVANIKDRLSGPGSARRLAVRTGFLRGSWREQRIGQEARRVFSNAKYNMIHEMGGPIKRGGRVVGQMPERPFIRPALKDWIPIAARIFRNQLDEANAEVQRTADRLRREGYAVGATR